MSNTLSELIAQGWRLRYVDPLSLVDHASHVRGESDQAACAWADLFEAWGRLSRGEREDCDRCLASARIAMQGVSDIEGRVACDELATYLLARDGDCEAAMRCGAAALALPADALSPVMRYNVLSRHGIVLESSGRTDEALHAHYDTVAAARRTGEPAFVATSLGALGGLQSSLLNLEDAQPLCAEAWSLCEQWQWINVTSFVGLNHMMVLSGLGRHGDALAMADRMIALEERFTARHRAQRHTLYGVVLTAAGELERAQAMLDRSHVLVKAASAEGVPRIEWAWSQARVWNRVGRARDALELACTYLASSPPGRQDVAFPIDIANLRAEAALACEALGDLAGALRHEREAARAREEAAHRAAHAQRVTMQINLQLDAATRERDRAVQEQQRLAQVNAALESANQAKTRFLAAASHDLRQPIHALGLQLAALRDVLPPGPAQGIGQRIEGTVGALGSMFNLLLDMSRMDAGVMPVRRIDADLRPLLVRLIDEFAPAAADKRLRLALRLPAHCAATTDAMLLERLLRNLIDNAIKYTEHGGVLVTLRRAGAGRWRLQVWDTGCGIAVEEQARVFDEFYQVGNRARDRAQGLGLGLSIVRRLAHMLNHRLTLSSRPGHGSCFSIELPATEIAPVEPKLLVHGADFGEDLCIAVIEDDADVRDAMRLLLQRWGHRVVDGIDHHGVLAQCVDGCVPVAVIADDQLPGARNGAAEAAALGDALERALPTLIVTGDSSPQRLRALSDAGLAWLSKPVAPVRLRSWLAGIRS
jgi:signal transduction histidine kinase/CheY-like chemotaxis protein